MTFDKKIATYAQMIEGRLDALLSDDLGMSGPALEGRLRDAMRYSVLNGGKRLRPFLVLESAALFGIEPEGALDAACAVEFMHCYSLVHDDLPAMDDDDLRRGQPTVHKKFDEAIAILAGDSLLTFAFEVMSRADTHADHEVRCGLVSGLARASGYLGMAGGQALDLAAEDTQDLNMDDILSIQVLKTGALIEFSLDAGALLGGATARERSKLSGYGRAIGLAFQIADDLLDIEGDAGKLGKAVGKDAERGKKTILSHLGVSGARRRLDELEGRAVAALDIFGGRGSVLIEAARFIIRREH